MVGHTLEDKKQALRQSLVRDNGTVFSFDENRTATLKEYLDELPESFPDLSKYGLSLLYVYDRKQQREEKDRLSGGITFKSRRISKDGEKKETAFSIGIATETIDRGKIFTLSVFVHEAAHVLTYNSGEEEHTEIFGIVLDGLLARCAEAGLALERLPYPSDAQRGHRTRDRHSSL